MTALISKLKLQYSLSTSAWPNYGLDVLDIIMHTEVVIHSMNAYVWCWSKICGSLDEIPSLTMGSYKNKILTVLICIKRQTQRCNKILKVKVTMIRSKVQLRSHHDNAHL